MQLRVISVLVVLYAMSSYDVTHWTAVDSKQDRSQYGSLTLRLTAGDWWLPESCNRCTRQHSGEHKLSASTCLYLLYAWFYSFVVKKRYEKIVVLHTVQLVSLMSAFLSVCWIYFSALTLLVGWQEGLPACKNMGDDGDGHCLVQMEWRLARWSVCLLLLIFPCTLKSRSSLLAPAHPVGPWKRAVKWLWWWWYWMYISMCLLSCGLHVCQDVSWRDVWFQAWSLMAVSLFCWVMVHIQMTFTTNFSKLSCSLFLIITSINIK